MRGFPPLLALYTFIFAIFSELKTFKTHLIIRVSTRERRNKKVKNQEVKATVLEITGLEEDSSFIWIKLKFEDMKSSPGKNCEVNIPLKKEEIEDLNMDRIRKQALTEATFFLARILSFSYD